MVEVFEKKVSDFCIFHSMFNKGKVLVALSGGGDSVALLHVLVTLIKSFDITIEAAHLNHSLRGDESEADEVFCRELCQNLNIILTVKRLSKGEIQHHKGSSETVARELRRNFLLQTATERNCHRIATGHTLDDQAETLLQRILRGTGPSGLAGIVPVHEGLLVRPLLGVTKIETRQYLVERDIPFREDSTNLDTSYFRNRIRHELIPFIQERLSPQVTVTLGRLAELSRIQEEYLEGTTCEAYKSLLLHNDRWKILLDKHRFMSYHSFIQQSIVRHCLEKLEGVGRDTDMDEITIILDKCHQKRATFDITSKIKCGMDGKFIVFMRCPMPYEPIPLPIPGELDIPYDGGRISTHWGSFKSKEVDGKTCVAVQAGIVERYGVLSVCRAKPGDTIFPPGKRKEEKMFDIFSSLSIPKILRSSIPVVRAGAVILWIPGILSSNLLQCASLDDQAVFCAYSNGFRW